MQLTIDSFETPASLRLAAAILTFIANHNESPKPSAVPVVPIDPIPPAPVPPVPASTASETVDPADESVDAEVSDLPLDSAGIAWNPELHTANQSKTSDGTWRRKRTPRSESPAPKTVELPAVPPPPPLKAQATVEPIATVPPAPIVEATPGAPPVPAVPPAPPVSTVASTGSQIQTFPALVKFVTNLVGMKKISSPQILEACAAVGVADIHACALPQNVAFIPAVAAAIEARVVA